MYSFCKFVLKQNFGLDISGKNSSRFVLFLCEMMSPPFLNHHNLPFKASAMILLSIIVNCRGCEQNQRSYCHL